LTADPKPFSREISPDHRTSLPPGYEFLPQLAQALIDAGFGSADVAKILGGNYVRLFEASLA
jgi:hypothetical protein